MQRTNIVLCLFLTLAVGGVATTAWMAGQARDESAEMTASLHAELNQVNAALEQAQQSVENMTQVQCPQCPQCPSVAPSDCPAPRPAALLLEPAAKTPPDGRNPQVDKLSDKVNYLEKRLASTRDSLAESRVREQHRLERQQRRTRNRDRFRVIEEKERTQSPEAFEAARTLYRDGLKEKTEAGRLEKLSQLVEQYPDSNRAATAAVQLAQEYLKRKDYESARHYLEAARSVDQGALFKDGVAVAPQTLFYLGLVEAKQGNTAAAEEHWNDVIRLYPEAMTHSGRPLAEVIASERSQLPGQEETP